MRELLKLPEIQAVVQLQIIDRSGNKSVMTPWPAHQTKTKAGILPYSKISWPILGRICTVSVLIVGITIQYSLITALRTAAWTQVILQVQRQNKWDSTNVFEGDRSSDLKWSLSSGSGYLIHYNNYVRSTERSPRSPDTPIWIRLEHFSTLIHPTPFLTLSPQLSLLSSIHHHPVIIIHSCTLPSLLDSPLLHWGLSD